MYDAIAIALIALFFGIIGAVITLGTMPSLRECEAAHGKRCHWVATPMDDRR
jgi:hypothetical protein